MVKRENAMGSTNISHPKPPLLSLLSHSDEPSSTSSSSLKKKSPRIFRRGETATWKIETTQQDEYKTEESEEYLDPKSKQESETRSRYLIQLEKHKEILREKALEKFEKIANERYGSIAQLFQAVSIFVCMMNSLVFLIQFNRFKKLKELSL